jgi:hypothetical protein
MLSSLLLRCLANDRLPKLFHRYNVCGPHVTVCGADSHFRITKREASGNKIVPPILLPSQTGNDREYKTHCLAVNMPEKCKVINHSNYADGCPRNSELTNRVGYQKHNLNLELLLTFKRLSYEMLHQ